MDFFDFFNSGDILQNIRDLIHCPFCGSDYFDEDIRVVGKSKKSYMFHLLCGDCGNSIMASFSYKEGMDTDKREKKARKGDTIEKKKYDVKLKEMAYFLDKGGISDDCVMDLYKVIQDFDGNFKRLIGR